MAVPTIMINFKHHIYPVCTRWDSQRLQPMTFFKPECFATHPFKLSSAVTAQQQLEVLDRFAPPRIGSSKRAEGDQLGG